MAISWDGLGVLLWSGLMAIGMSLAPGCIELGPIGIEECIDDCRARTTSCEGETIVCLAELSACARAVDDCMWSCPEPVDAACLRSCLDGMDVCEGMLVECLASYEACQADMMACINLCVGELEDTIDESL